MSLALTVRCDGTRRGRPCGAERTSVLGYSPHDGWDDHAARLPAIVPRLVDGWRRGRHDGSDLCPRVDHDRDPQPPERTAHPDLEHARQTLEARRANEGLT